MLCAKCGAEVAKEDTYCRRCGTPIAEPKAFPARIAGWIWMLLGLLFICGGVLLIVVTPKGAPVESMIAILLLLIMVIFGLLFGYAGLQVVKGRASGLIWRGIGSLLLGLIGLAANIDYSIAAMFPALMLILAGLLALVGIKGYRQWQHKNKAVNPSSLPEDGY